MYTKSDEYSTSKIKFFESHQKFSRMAAGVITVKIAMSGWKNG